MLLLFHIATGMLLLSIVTAMASVFHLDLVVPSVPIIAVVAAAAHRDLGHTLLVGLIVGGAAATLFGDARGVYLLALLVPILALRFLQARVPVSGVLGLGGHVVLGVLLHDLAMALLLTALGAGVVPMTTLAQTLVRLTPLTALVSAAVALPLFGLLRLVEPLLRGRDDHHALVL